MGLVKTYCWLYVLYYTIHTSYTYQLEPRADVTNSKYIGSNAMELYFMLNKILKGIFMISGLFFSKRDLRAQALSILWLHHSPHRDFQGH